MTGAAFGLSRLGTLFPSLTREQVKATYDAAEHEHFRVLDREAGALRR